MSKGLKGFANISISTTMYKTQFRIFIATFSLEGVCNIHYDLLRVSDPRTFQKRCPKAVLLNLFDFAAHFSPRLWFWAHFRKNLFQNSWLGVIIALSRNISQPTWRSFAAARLRSAALKHAASCCLPFSVSPRKNNHIC